MRMLRIRRALAVMLVPAAGAAFGQQQVPDAGRLLQEIRPAPSLPQRPAPDIRIEETPPAQAAEGPRIHVAHVSITGATVIPESELHALVADAEDKELSLDDLRRLAERISEHYRSKGYLLARAYVPAQDVTGGDVRIAVVEGRLGRVTVDNDAGLGGAALAPLDRLRAGEVAQGRSLERDLLLLSDLPGVEVKSTLKPGATPGASDLLVQVSPGRQVTGSVDFDNHGDRFSGQYRLGGTVNVNNPLRLGDQATLRAIASDEGMAYLRGSYQAPVTARGTRVGIAASGMRYRLGKELAPLGAKGDAQVGSLYALHPLVRSRAFNLNVQLQYDRLRLKDRITSTATEVDKGLDNWTAGITGDVQDGLAGANSFSAAYTRGDLHLDAATRTLDAQTARTAGNFGHWNLSWQRLQPLGNAFVLYASAAAQFASKNLDSSQKFSLGGVYGVRAYPQNEAPGDEGYLATLEARHVLALALPGVWQMAAFVDTGHVKQNREPWSAGANSRTLSGFGFGLNAALSRDWYLKAVLARRIGAAHPVSDTERTVRFWLQAGRPF